MACLFQFICSSNNHIRRIHGMVERLCRNYGTRLHVSEEAQPLSGLVAAQLPAGATDSACIETAASPVAPTTPGAASTAVLAKGSATRARLRCWCCPIPNAMQIRSAPGLHLRGLYVTGHSARSCACFTSWILRHPPT